MSNSLTAELLISADGWAGSDGLPGYFGYLGPELEEHFAAQTEDPHVAVMGRKTFELLSQLPDDAKDESWERMSREETVVFSRTLDEAPQWPGARVCSTDLLIEVRRLKEGDRRVRTVGSLSIVRQLVDGGLVDRLRLLIFPLFAGDAGREWAYADLAPNELELTDHRVIDGRILLVEYRPTGKDVPRA